MAERVVLQDFFGFIILVQNLCPVGRKSCYKMQEFILSCCEMISCDHTIKVGVKSEVLIPHF